jgi:transcriptional regulator with XRE-family HTH domain
MTGKATFARRLREAREAKGISQKQLGILAGIDQFVASARINQYEREKHVPDLLMAEKLAQELGVPVSFFYEPDENLARLL